MAADMRIQKLSIILKEHPNIIYASKLININDIVQQYKEWNNRCNKDDMVTNVKKRKNEPDLY
ncbi:38941_t:CDS:1, partial [Gigaspora margarita]